jgi:hypothetical protein
MKERIYTENTEGTEERSKKSEKERWRRIAAARGKGAKRDG